MFLSWKGEGRRCAEATRAAPFWRCRPRCHRAPRGAGGRGRARARSPASCQFASDQRRAPGAPGAAREDSRSLGSLIRSLFCRAGRARGAGGSATRRRPTARPIPLEGGPLREESAPDESGERGSCAKIDLSAPHRIARLWGGRDWRPAPRARLHNDGEGRPSRAVGRLAR